MSRRARAAGPLLLTVVAVAALAVGGCGSSGEKFSATPSDYIPEAINQRPVAPTSGIAGSLAKSLSGGDLTTASGAIGSPRVKHPLPDGVIIAIHGDAAALAKVDDRAGKTFLAGTKPTTSTLDGTTVTAGKFRQGSLQAAIATAAPRPDIRLLALSFDGSPANATKLMQAMLDEGRTSKA